MSTGSKKFQVPVVTDYGSLKDLTQQNTFGPETDSGLNIPGNPFHHGPSQPVGP